jgi:regulator of RNase E activity RraA
MLSNAAHLRGVSGVIVEGPARDVDEATAIRFPIFSRTTTSRTARGRVHEIANGVPIMVGDVLVAENDYVAADSSGVMFIAAASVESLLQVAEKIAANEAAMTKQILTGRPVGLVLSEKYERMLQDGGQ